MKLTLDAVRKKGGFVGGIVKQKVKWKDAEGSEAEYDVWIRPMSYRAAVDDAKSMMDGGIDNVAVRIHRHVCDEEGFPLFPNLSDITGLNEDGSPVMIDGEEQGALSPELANALMVAVNEASGVGKLKGNSARKGSSSTPSSTTASAAGRSKKPRKT